MTRDNKTPTPLTDRLEQKHCAAYTANQLERAFKDAVNRHKQLERQLAEARRDKERLDGILTGAVRLSEGNDDQMAEWLRHSKKAAMIFGNVMRYNMRKDAQ